MTCLPFGAGVTAMKTAHSIPARWIRRWCAIIVSMAIMAILAHSASAQLVPTNQEALKRAMERKQQEREQAQTSNTNEADADQTELQEQLDRQSKLLGKASDALTEVEKQIASGEHRKAAGTLMQIRRVFREPRVARIEAMLGRIALLENRPDQAMRFVEPWSTKPDIYDRSNFEAHLVAGDALLAPGKSTHDPQKALVLLDWLTAVETEAANRDYIGSANVVRAAEATGRALIAVERYRDALNAFKFAQNYARSQLGDYLGEEPLKSTLARVNENARKAQRLWDIERYGEAFVLFRDAETLRRSKDNHGKALPIYQDIIQRWPDSPFAEASRLYEALCLVQLRRYGQTEVKLKVFHESDPSGLWRGEALLELGRIAVERRVDPKLAEQHFTKLDEWIATVRKDDAPWNYANLIPGIREAAGEVVRPPQSEKYKDRWGNIKFNDIRPGELVNRKIAPWYLDNLEEQCAKFRGFLAFARGENEAALEHYVRIPKLDPTISAAGTLATNPNDYHRLKFGPENGYLVAYPQELKLYSGRQHFAVLLGDFYYITQQFDKATEICDRLLAGEFGRLNSAQQDYPHYLLGSALYRGKWKAGANSAELAIRTWDKILANRDGTFTEPRVAVIISNVARMVGNPEVQQHGQQLLIETASSNADHPWVHEAKIILAFDLMWEQRDEQAKRLLRRVPSSAGEKYERAQHIIAQLDDPKSTLWRFLQRTP